MGGDGVTWSEMGREASEAIVGHLDPSVVLSGHLATISTNSESGDGEMARIVREESARSWRYLTQLYHLNQLNQFVLVREGERGWVFVYVLALGGPPNSLNWLKWQIPRRRA